MCFTLAGNWSTLSCISLLPSEERVINVFCWGCCWRFSINGTKLPPGTPEVPGGGRGMGGGSVGVPRGGGYWGVQGGFGGGVGGDFVAPHVGPKAPNMQDYAHFTPNATLFTCTTLPFTRGP